MPKTYSGFAEINGSKTYYEVAGEGHPLVLVHGFSLDTRMWDDQWDVFAEGYRVVRYDVRGFGQTAPTGSMPYSRSDDLAALLDHLDIESAHIVGLSMGGDIALEFAISYPDRTIALIPVDAAIGGYNRTNVFATALQALSEQGMEAAIQAWMDSPLFKPAMDNLKCAPRLKEIASGYSGWHWTEGSTRTSLDPPANERLREISAPTLVIVGEHDITDFHLMASRMEGMIPKAKKVVMSASLVSVLSSWMNSNNSRKLPVTSAETNPSV